MAVHKLNAPTPPNSPQAIVTQIGEIMLRDGYWEGDIFNQRKDGSTFWTHTKILFFDHEVYGRVFLAIQQDITVQKEAEQALHESETRFSSVISSVNAHFYVSVISDKGVFYNHYISPQVEKLTGYVAIKFMEEWDFWTSLIHPDDLPVCQAQIARLRKGLDGVIEYRIRTIFGNMIWVQDNARVIHQLDGTYTVYATIIDITEFKEAEAAVRASEKRYRQMFELHGLPKLIVDAETGQILDANSAATRFYGASYGRLLSLTMFDISVTPEAYVRARLELAASAKMLSCVFVHRAAGGVERDVEVFTGPIEIDGKKHLQTIVTDITEKRKAERALKESKELLESRVAERTLELARTKNRIETIFNSTSEAILLLDQDICVQQANETYYQLFGIERDTYQFGRPLQSLFHKDDWQFLDDLWMRTLLESAPSGLEVRARRGAQYFDADINVRPISHSFESGIFFVCTVRDVTTNLQAARDLRESERLLRKMAENFPKSFVSIIEADLTVGFTAGQEFKTLGLNPDDFVGMTLDQVFGENAELVRSYYEKTFKGEEQTFELELNEQFQLYRTVPLVDDDGEITRILAVVENVTELRAAERTLRDSLRKEQELSELKSRFVSMASHEFRTPLASILATAETLSMYRPHLTDEQVNDRLNKIRQQVMYLKAVMDDVLELARIQAGRLGFDPIYADLDQLCQDVTEEFDEQSEYRGRILYQSFHVPLMVRFDERLMRHMLSNLLSNALKYSPEMSPVDFRLSLVDKHVVIAVQDYGIGIPEKDLAHLGEPFHRAENVVGISGTGLGLNITRNAVDAHGGLLVIQSEIGVGSEFTIKIPVEE